tara:strand:- start:2382 stop:2894 length:513 start_codon:yes stop_codon:yes gene_type:complete
MNNFFIKFKNYGLLELLVFASAAYVVGMLLWTASTRSAVEEKANTVKSNHKQIVDFINSEINSCDQNDENSKTIWGDPCKGEWLSKNIIEYINDNMKMVNPYLSNKEIIKQAQDPRLQAEGKAGQSTEMGVIFLSSQNFSPEAGSEWVIGTCVKSPCVAAGNNELTSVYR